MADVPTLSDGVVTLRGHRPDDAQGCYEQCQDPLSRAWTTVPLPYTLEMAQEFVGVTMPRAWLDDSEWGFAIEVGGRYAGTVSLRNEGDGRAEIAYGSHPRIRGTGAVERALRLLLTWGFDDRDLQTVIWWANRGNWASRKLAWRLGFTMEGTLRQWLPQRGELRDAWVGTLLRDDPRTPRTTWLACPVLEGDGFRLRPIVAGDAARIQEACSDERTQRWLGQLPSPYTLEDALAYVESCVEMLATGAGVTWAVADPEDDRLLGTIGWFHWRPDVECEIGYWTHPDARGRGLMSRVMRMMTTHVVTDPGVVRLTAFAAVDNAASRHVIESAGFRHYAVERLSAGVRGGRADLALYDVLASEIGSESGSSTQNPAASTSSPPSESAAPTTSGDR